MAIRYKTICTYWKEDENRDWYCEPGFEEEVPIKEWNIPHFSFRLNYTKGEETPVGRTTSIVFPELWLWNDRQSNQVVFGLEVSYSSSETEWLSVSSSDLQGNDFSTENLERTSLYINFRNLLLLSKGLHSASIQLKAYWKKDTGDIFIENAPQTINISINVSDNDNGTPPTAGFHDAGEKTITYNRSTGVLSGELFLDYPVGNNIIQDQPNFLGLERSGTGYSIIKNTQMSQSAIGVYLGIVVIRSPAGEWRYTIRLIVVENEQNSDFFITPMSFSFSLSKTESVSKRATANIINPQDLSIQVVKKPTFIASAIIQDDQLLFETVNASTLSVGNYEGKIILQSEQITKELHISLKVVQPLVSDFYGQPYYFSLDKHKIIATKINTQASYIKLSIEMIYQGFGNILRETQEYIYPFFGAEIELFPGEEIQDFFIRLTTISQLPIVQYQYHLAVVNIIVKEYDANDQELSENRIDNVLFAPGKKPKCFPIFTDFPKRRTFNNSKIRLNTDITSDRFLDFGFEPIPSKMQVYAFNLERKALGRENEIISTNGIDFIPFPEPCGGKVIHIFFENQNLVLDWFSCPASFHKKYDFNHVINEDTGEKYATLETENLVLNTGWILREEIELVNAIIRSRICFIIIDNEVIKARPMSKKNEMYDTEENLFSMDLEFNIKQNER